MISLVKDQPKNGRRILFSLLLQLQTKIICTGDGIIYGNALCTDLRSNKVWVHDPQVEVVGMADPLLVRFLCLFKCQEDGVFFRLVGKGTTSLEAQIAN